MAGGLRYVVLLICKLLLLTASISATDRYYFDHLSNQHGLSSDVIMDIIQDQQGFLWFCTEDGLNRYDGYTFTKYRKDYDHQNSLVDNYTTCITEDLTNRLWIGTRNHGISIYDPNSGIFEQVSTTYGSVRLPTNNINALYADKLGNIWIGTENYGIMRISEAGVLTIYRTKHKHLANLINIKAIYEDQDGRLWIGSWNHGLFYYNAEDDDFVNIELPWSANLLARPVISIHQAADGKYWVGSWGHGLWILEGSVEKGFEVTHHPYLHKNYFQYGHRAPSGDLAFSIDSDSRGYVWVGSNNGVAVFEPGNVLMPLLIETDINNRFAPDNSLVSKVFVDKEGLIWLGTEGSGIHKINTWRNSFFSHYIPHSPSNIFQETSVFSMFEKDEDVLLIGIKSEGFYEYNRKTDEFIPYRDIPFYSGIPIINLAYGFERDHSGRVWMGTRYQGVQVFDYDNNEFFSLSTRFRRFNARTSYTLMRDVDNNMWIGTRNGLFIFKWHEETTGGSYELLHYTHNPGDSRSISCNHVVSVLQDSKGHIWIGTLNGGVNRFSGIFPGEDMVFERYLSDTLSNTQITGNRINDIFEDLSGRIWVGMEGGGGLGLFDPDKEGFTMLSAVDDLPGDHVFAIHQDKEAIFWLSTNRGIVRMDADDVDNLKFTFFTAADGLQGNVFIRGSKLVTPDGMLYFGGYNGFNAFNPGNNLPEIVQPEVAITNIMLRNETIRYDPDSGKPLVISHRDKVLNVHFTVTSFKDPGNNRFAFKLEGFDDDWNFRDATSRQAVYTNLKRGKYTLYIIAANANGIWSEKPVKLDLIVKPALFASDLAFISYAIIFFLIIYGLMRLMLYRATVQQQLQLEKIEQKRLEQVHQLKLRSFANVSHELLTPLSVINVIIDNTLAKKGDSQEVFGLLKKNVGKLRKLIDQLLLMRKIDTGHLKLKVHEGELSNFLRDIYQGFTPLAAKKNLKFDFICEEIPLSGYFDGEKLETIVQNLLSNAIKFTDTGSVELHCRTFYRNDTRWAEVIVKDTGCGISEEDIEAIFERFARLNDNKAIPGMGIGLDLVRSLTRLHKGHLDVSSFPGQGTAFTVEIALDIGHYSMEEISRQQALSQHVDVVDELLEKGLAEHQDIFIKPKEHPVIHSRTLLLVEDNDDLRQLIGKFLFGHFQVEQAEDGAAAYEIAKYLSPDIIVSDVIMPKMNGFELCNKIKSDFSTSHIPVILLTAKTDDSSKTEAYGYGADSYLTKPVNLELLITRINSILDARDGMKEYYRRRCVFTPELSNIQIPQLDETFIKQATEIIKKNMEDPEFNVQSLTVEMGTSNSMLYRKFNKLLGVTPNELIKNIRIKYAAELLSQGKYTVSEVAYSIGFNDLSYFGKCFKKAYGVSPSDFKENPSVSQSV